MAFAFLKKKFTNNLTIKGYSINTEYDKILGKGAYGIVYRATDTKNKTVASKTIDGKLHHRILTQDLHKLTELNHDNIVRMLDCYQQNDTFWMFMEFCCHGDLNDFFYKRN